MTIARPAIFDRCRWLVALAGLLLASTAAAAATPARVSASYDVLRNGAKVGVVTESFEQRNGTYRIRSESRATGIASLFARGTIVVTSEGIVAEGGLRPRRFEHARGTDAANTVVAELDWSARQITLRHGGAVETAALERNLQDRLSAMYQFMFLPLARTSEVHLVVTNGSKVERYRYDVRHGVAIETPLARMPGIHLVKQRTPEDNGTEIWLAPAHHQLPARVLITESNGDRLEQVLTRLEVSD
jgi:hypothetical protein